MLFLFFGLFFSLVVLIWYYETYHLVSKHFSLEKTATEMKLVSESKPATNTKLKIAQISDLHFSRFYSVKQFEKVIQKLAIEKPDLILFTGDLIENKRYLKPGDPEKITTQLQKLQAPYGKLAILGNHDYRSSGKELTSRMLTDGGFTLLTNDSILLSDLDLALTGIDDARAGTPDYTTSPKAATFSILLVHEPDQVKHVQADFDLILVGHSHGGQIKLPFYHYQNRGSKDYLAGMYHLNPSSFLYVNTGIGTTGPPLRLGVLPEVCFFELTYETKNETFY